ncbi:MAG TPA: xanthine dehydrogenase family protein subunit M [Rhizomicrobium sp.]|nr:xanthine dehydrogenase family protein subunit M [Rhizomicrobium sp.]
MITYPFAYSRPKSLAEAEAALKSTSDAKLIAGGQTLVATMKQRLASPSLLIDIARLGELRFIRREGDQFVVGAGVRHHDVATSEDLHKGLPALAELAETIGDPAVRHMGTLGGSLANNDPAADYPAGVLALSATITTTKRTIAADDFFQGMFTTALEDDEIIKQVAFPIVEKAAYAKFKNPASRYALAGVFVAKGKSGVRVAVTGAGSSVFRVADMEAALTKNFAPEAVANIAVAADDLNSDIHASAEYRAHLVTVMAKRAVKAALERS